MDDASQTSPTTLKISRVGCVMNRKLDCAIRTDPDPGAGYARRLQTSPGGPRDGMNQQKYINHV